MYEVAGSDRKVRQFSLSPAFIADFEGRQPNWGPVGYFTYKRTYARPTCDCDDPGVCGHPSEEFWETCKRVVEGVYNVQKMHCRRLSLPWNEPKAQQSAQEMFRRMWEFKWTPPGRGLWMMGTPFMLQKGGASINNCFAPETKAWVQQSGFDGPRLATLGELAEFSGGERAITVLAGDGQMRPATARSFGVQKLVKVSFGPVGLRSNYRLEYDVTPNHRWLLSDGSETTALKVGDRVKITPQGYFQSDDETEIEGFAHGLIFGDGARHTYYADRHQIRLCGAKEQVHLARLEASPFHFNTTYPESYNGDAMVWFKLNDGMNWKALPRENSSAAYQRAFLHGWIAADGTQKPAGTICLNTQNHEAAQWLIERAPLLGFCVIGFNYDPVMETNYGPRSAPMARITLTTEVTEYVVKSITDEGREEEVFCVTEPETGTFTLEGGLVTGNCAFTSTEHIDEDFAGPFTFLMDMSMLGVGVGGDTRGVGKVRIQTPKMGDDVFPVADSREGWVALARTIINSFVGKGSFPTTIDFSAVRPKGKRIRGFGGIASGPGPLAKLVRSIATTLAPEGVEVQFEETFHPETNEVHRLQTFFYGEGKPYKIGTSHIADVFNMVGACVVAGGVRRSAEILFGQADDEEFRTLKDPSKLIAMTQQLSRMKAALADTEGLTGKANEEARANLSRDIETLEGQINEHPLRSHRWACVTGDTVVDTSEGSVPIRTLVGRTDVQVLLDGQHHRALGVKKTGHEPVFRVHTQGGPEIRATGNHPVMTTRGWVRVDQLRVGVDRLVVSDNKSLMEAVDFESRDYKQGYLIGALIGDGTFTRTTTTGSDIARIMTYIGDDGGDSLREFMGGIFDFPTRADFSGFSGPHGKGSSAYHFISCKAFTKLAAQYGVRRGTKTLTPEIEAASLPFVAGVISGLFDADGYVMPARKTWGIDVADGDLLTVLQRMLLRLGIVSRVHKVREAQEKQIVGGRTTHSQPVYRLVLAGFGEASRFVRMCGIHHSGKASRWACVTEPPSVKMRHTFLLDSVTPAGHEDVFDICVPGPDAFSANGLYVHNSNNSIFGTVGMDYAEVAESIAKNGEPGIFWLKNAQDFSRMKDPANHKDRRVLGCNPCSEQSLESYELCVGGNTRITTRTGAPLIQDTVGKTIEVWNGVAWSSVTPFITGQERSLFRVHLSDGSYLDCTDNHRWEVLPDGKRAFREVETKDLVLGSQVMPFNINLPCEGDSLPCAYEWGFFAGDGFLDNAQVMSKLHGVSDRKLEGVLRGKVYKEQHPEGYAEPFVRVNFTGNFREIFPEDYLDRARDLNNKVTGLPDWLFSLDRESTLRFIAGWIDADGTLNKQVNTDNYTVYGTEAKIRDLQMLLRRVGVNHASVFLNAEAGQELVINGHPTVRNHNLWVCLIPSYEGEEISRYCHLKVARRFGSRYATNNAHPEGAPIDRARKQKIVDIEELPGKHTTYCFDEPERHMAVFNNVLTHQCTLVETYPAHHDSYDDFQRTLKFAYLYAKTVTLIPTHDPRANAVMNRNRRIGCSMSGIRQAVDKLGRREFLNWCDRGYTYIQELDTTYSEWLGIPLSIKTTSVKPSGTVSLLCGATPGIHPPHSPYYIRNIRVSEHSPLLKAAQEAGYRTEKDAYADATWVISFPVSSDCHKGKRDVSIWEQVALAADMQRHWADNQVSVTVTFRPEEAKEIAPVLEVFEDRLKSISFLPLGDDHGYVQAPYIEITESEYREMSAKVKDMVMDHHIRTEAEDKFCDGGSCEVDFSKPKGT